MIFPFFFFQKKLVDFASKVGGIDRHLYEDFDPSPRRKKPYSKA